MMCCNVIDVGFLLFVGGYLLVYVRFCIGIWGFVGGFLWGVLYGGGGLGF